jgi:hypothetical protein
MTIRGIIWAILLCIAAIIGAGVSIHGVWSFLAIDLKQDTAMSFIYCAVQVLCFPVFLLARPVSRAAFVLSLMALVYLAVYSALNWRTCSEYGYCQSVIGTVLQTLSTNTVLGFFAVVILSLIAILVDDHSAGWRYQK